MKKRRIIYIKTDNPFYEPRFLPNGAVFIPTGRPIITTDHAAKGAVHWNPAYWSKKLAPGDRAILQVGLHATRGSHEWPKGSLIPLRKLADAVSDYRATHARAGGATIVSQLGRYEHKGHIIRERSASITIIREPKESWGAFQSSIREMAMFLIRRYGQWEIYVDYVRGGRTVEARKAFWKDSR